MGAFLSKITAFAKRNGTHAALGIVVYLVVQKVLAKLRNRPPRPMALPLLGNLYLLPQPGEAPGVHKAMWGLVQKFGPIMGFFFGSKYTIVVSSPKLVYEALRKKGDDFAGRFVVPSMDIITKGRGIALQPDLKIWRKARTALMQSVTKKQIGESSSELILEETHSLVNEFVKLCGSKGWATDVPFRLHTKRESINVIMRMVFGFRYGAELSPEFRDMSAMLEEIFKRISAGNPSDYMPLLAYLPGDPNKELQAVTDRRDKYITSWIDEHRRTLDPANPRDFLDSMLINKEKDGLTDTDIHIICWDCLAGGIDTSATSMEWLVYILINHPEVQARAQAELDEVVGPDRLPTYEDRHKMPYIKALVCELFRYKHFAPFGIPHATIRDTTLGGYNIPKNTQVMFNFYALHMDKKLWKRPEEFRPERFLEEESHMIDYFEHAEKAKRSVDSFKYVPFGAGKRMCVGFGLGRVIMWLKIATHLHCFKFQSASGKPLDTDTEHFGVTLVPNEYNIKITARPASRLAKSIEGKGNEH